MPLIKHIEISDLQPIQDKAHITKINYYSSMDSKYQKTSLPEVWEIKNKIYIVDGHHRILANHFKKKEKIKVIFHNPKDYSNKKESYKYVTEEILKFGNQIKSKGIYHIKDLKLV